MTTHLHAVEVRPVNLELPRTQAPHEVPILLTANPMRANPLLAPLSSQHMHRYHRPRASVPALRCSLLLLRPPGAWIIPGPAGRSSSSRSSPYSCSTSARSQGQSRSSNRAAAPPPLDRAAARLAAAVARLQLPCPPSSARPSSSGRSRAHSKCCRTPGRPPRSIRAGAGQPLQDLTAAEAEAHPNTWWRRRWSRPSDCGSSSSIRRCR